MGQGRIEEDPDMLDEKRLKRGPKEESVVKHRITGRMIRRQDRDQVKEREKNYAGLNHRHA